MKRCGTCRQIKPLAEHLSRREYLAAHPCVDCGATDLRILDFDHRPGSDTRADVMRLVRDGHSIATVSAEVARCDVRCRNCHAIVTYARAGGTWRERTMLRAASTTTASAYHPPEPPATPFPPSTRSGRVGASADGCSRGPMMATLTDRHVAFLATDGFEDSELTVPWNALTAAGASATMIAPAADDITGENGHVQRVDVSADAAQVDRFDALVLPGGVVNADHLRLDQPSIALVRAFVAQHKPVGVICHGAWILIEADAVDGRTLTSHPSLRTDLRNAGASWVDEEVVVGDGIVSSRTPEDLPAFTASLVQAIAEGSQSV